MKKKTRIPSIILKNKLKTQNHEITSETTENLKLYAGYVAFINFVLLIFLIIYKFDSQYIMTYEVHRTTLMRELSDLII
jgi:hypothetical protein